SSRCRGLPDLAGDAAVGVHPGDAAALSLTDGRVVEVDTGAASARVPVAVTDAVPPGHLLVPVGFPEFPRARWAASGRRLRARIRVLEPAGRESR
ncbi:MAG: molybdopterin dinucleotide binding domain-containing protein, partial [Armatimonadota bacterium]|nr:molybdopterin dinucleotide binding domain-containing protein [Armatimonadota bacterium]